MGTIKIKVKPYSEIKGHDFGPGFEKSMRKFCGKTLEFDAELTHNGCFRDTFGCIWISDWLELTPELKRKYKSAFKLSKDMLKAEYFEEGSLLDDYSVTAGKFIEVGCQKISKKQEKAWFKLLAKRLGYELKG